MCLLLTVNIILSWPSSAVLCSLVRNIQTNLGPIVPWVRARNKTNNASHGSSTSSTALHNKLTAMKI